MRTTVIHIRDSSPRGSEAAADEVYIGRPGKGQPGPFGNPAPAPAAQGGAGHTREASLRWFAEYFHCRLEFDPAFRRSVEALRGKRLVCFCRPEKACHGDTIAEYVNSLPAEPAAGTER